MMTFRNQLITDGGNDVIHNDVTVNVACEGQNSPSGVLGRFWASMHYFEISGIRLNKALSKIYIQ